MHGPMVIRHDRRAMPLEQLHESGQGMCSDCRRIVRHIEGKTIRPPVGGIHKLSDATAP
jgi:hypothetical protein